MTHTTVSPSNLLIITTDTAEAPAAPVVNTADTTNPTDSSAANANDTISDDEGTPCISKRKYGKQLHPLLTKQPIQKSFCGKKLITHSQRLYASASGIGRSGFNGGGLFPVEMGVESRCC